MKRRYMLAWWLGGAIVLLLFMRAFTDASWINSILVAIIVGSIATASEASRQRRRKS